VIRLILGQFIAVGLALALIIASASAEDPPAQSEYAPAASEHSNTTFANQFRDRTHVSGTLELESAIQLRDGDMQKFEMQLDPEFEFSLPKDIDLTVIPRLRWDPADQLAPGRPSQDSSAEYNRSLYIGDTLELELREAYLDATVGETFLRIGKQQVVWGKADGLKVLDVVNPQDFREFILDDFDDSRIPLWTVSADIPIKSATLQLLWIPDRTYHRLPEPGATYEFISNVPQPPPGVPVTLNEVDRPDNFFTGSDFGARLSALWGGWDVTLNYLYQYDKFPVLYRTINAGPGGPSVTVNPSYERLHVLGGSFSNAFGDLTFRGEVAFKIDKFYPTTNAADVDGVENTDELEYVLGFDWFGISETFMSFQFFQSVLMDDAPGLLRDRVENNLTFLVQREFMNDALTLSAIWIQSLNHGDGVIRPAIEYELRSNLRISAGFDIFYGKNTGLFGEFNDATRFVAGIEWAF
jgi:hypothetical protein